MSRYLVSALILFGVTKASTSSAKQCYGPDYTEVFPFYGIPENICLHAYYNSSNTKSLTLTLTYGKMVIGTERISDIDPGSAEKTICDSSFPSPIKSFNDCSICLGFNGVYLSDEWAKICPKYDLQCNQPYKMKKSTSMPCFSVGNDDNDDIAQIVGGNTDFAFKLLSTNGMTEQIVTDLFVSPFSITNALIMAMMAANGDTLKQLMNAFELDTDDYAIFDSYNTLIEGLQHKSDDLINTVNNALWINNKWYKVISPQFLKDFNRFGEIVDCNFKNQSVIETQKIDKQTEDLTHNLIMHPLADKNLSNFTVMLFTNTMYFKGNWQFPFNHNISETFTDDNNDEITIPMMMTEKQQFNTYIDNDAEIIELPFSDQDLSDFSFIMIRPTQQKYLNDGPSNTIQFEKLLNRTLLKNWLNHLNTSNPQIIKLPYLTMYNMEDITDSLKSIGITNLFDPKTADLKNLTIPHYQVYETNFNRQDYLKLTPNGIEIASFVTDGDNGKDDTNQGPIKHADLPFLFLIMDRNVDLILYVGRITNPKGWVIDNNNNKHSHDSKVGMVIFGLLLVFMFSYCVIKFAYNITVMQLSGINAIPHIQQYRFCVNCCSHKISKLRGIGESDNVQSDDMSPPETYAELINQNDNMAL